MLMTLRPDDGPLRLVGMVDRIYFGTECVERIYSEKSSEIIFCFPIDSSFNLLDRFLF